MVVTLLCTNFRAPIFFPVESTVESIWRVTFDSMLHFIFDLYQNRYLMNQLLGNNTIPLDVLFVKTYKIHTTLRLFTAN